MDMNKKIIITILVITIITISSLTYSIITSENVEKQDSLQNQENSEIINMLDKIELDKKNNDVKKEYNPIDREWVKIGPFQIDRTQYALGEKIFINVENMPENMKGEIVFAKILNFTHSKIYKEIEFDGSKKQIIKFYVGIYPNVPANFCNSEEITGDWEIIFSGTNLVNHKFKIIDVVVPGLEDSFEPVC
jgi:hypothetical protein